MAHDGQALVEALERGREVDTFSIADMRSMLAFSTPRVVAYLNKLKDQVVLGKADVVVPENLVRVLEAKLEG